MTAARFAIRSRNGVEAVRLPGGKAVLSKAITRACQSPLPGVWTVLDGGAEVYRVTREDCARPGIVVEVLR